MKRHTLYVGLNDKETKRQEISTLEASKVVRNVILDFCDGATVYEADGFYKHHDGSVTIEKSLRIEVIHDKRTDILNIIDNLKKVLNQESVILQTETIQSELL